MADGIDLSHPATHVEVMPGGEIVLRGSFTSTHDGSTIDAATTTWPAGAPGGESVDPGGLVDFAAGGLHLTSRDPVSHEVHAIATGDPAPACAAAGIAAPCVALRTLPQARSRLMTVSDWSKSLKGGLTLEVPVPPAYAPAVSAASSVAPYLAGVGALGAVILGVVVFGRARRARASSPRGRLLALAERVEAKLGRVDAILAAPIAPAITMTIAKVKGRHIDPTSKEGLRVAAVLARVDARLDATAASARAAEEQAAADELVREMESALEAADEAERLVGR